MKTMFTRLFSIAAIATLTLAAFTVKAQTNSTVLAAIPAAKTETKADAKTEATATTPEKKAAEDTSWKLQRRIWGYVFGDLYYNAHADKTNRGGESMYNGVPQYRNAFQFRRIYLGYDYEITKKF